MPLNWIGQIWPFRKKTPVSNNNTQYELVKEAINIDLRKPRSDDSTTNNAETDEIILEKCNKYFLKN